MNSKSRVINIFTQTVQKEAAALSALTKHDFEALHDVLQLIQSRAGRVITTGIGKSGIVAKKLASTLSSTGTPSVYLHAVDASHGDIGMVQASDVVIIISKNGNNVEFKSILPSLRKIGVSVVSFISNANSYLSDHSDLSVYIPVAEEADPNNLAPTSSVIAHIAVGDALALALQSINQRTAEHFAALHPGGSLGKKLTLRVQDFQPELRTPKVSPDTSVRKTIIAITEGKSGAVAVLNDETIVGVVTDGDLRRMLERYEDIDKLTANDIMGMTPKTIEVSTMAVDALEIMEQHNISQLIVTKNGSYVGMIHLHDILSEGIS